MPLITQIKCTLKHTNPEASLYLLPVISNWYNTLIMICQLAMTSASIQALQRKLYDYLFFYNYNIIT